jgi:thiol-disulfide isomerase/thioredoxin
MKKVLWLLLAAFFLFANAQAQYTYIGEQTPLLEKEINYKDWTYKNFVSGKDVNLRDFTKDKKLVWVVYFAPWCHNWQHQRPLTERLYNKYKDKGLDVIGVSEYGTLDELRQHFGVDGPPFTVVVESNTLDARLKTTHYAYRQALGDTRKWGSPWNIFLTPQTLNKKGDVLTEKAFIVGGEILEGEVEKFIRKQLGLPDETVKTTTVSGKVEACEDDKKAVKLKVP